MKIGLIELLLIATAYICWIVLRPVWTEFLFYSSMTPYWLRQRISERFGISVGCCRHCGYNLKANRSGICPECGNIAEPVTPVRSVERPPKSWLPALMATAGAVTVFVAILIAIILW
jgi:hypothetical protein